MCDLIHFRLEGSLALIGLSRPPVNALSQPLRAAIIEACERAAADIRVQAIILYGEHGLFSAGADIGEFGTEACFAEPDLPSTLVRLTEIPKPLVAAMGKLALGGALELALACGYRMGSRAPGSACRKSTWACCPGRAGPSACPG